MKLNDAKQLERTVEEINTSIELMLSLAFEDYSGIQHLLKGPFKIGESNFVNGAVSDMVSSLQYYDTLNQRCEHIIKNHYSILHELQSEKQRHSYDHVVSRNILRLNQLQFQIANADYVTSIANIQRALSVQKTGHFVTPAEMKAIFTHSNLISKGMCVIEWKFSEAIKTGVGWFGLDLEPKLNRIEALYSMESERLVMQAYIANPSIEHDAVLQYQYRNQPDSSTIDLF
jgi:hypothetical protein